MQTSIATLTLEGLAPYSQSRQHDEPRLEGESHDAYDRRTWPSKQTVETRDGKRTVVVPAHAILQCFASAARYSKKQIPGQGKATWTAKFTSGLALLENPALNVDPSTVQHVVISANSDGKRGSGTRVPRRFPVIDVGWEFTTDIYILDPIITQSIFEEIVGISGMFIGIGRFRPEKGGTNGRFGLKALTWADNRELVPLAA
jgi:hypothetical protein